MKILMTGMTSLQHGINLMPPKKGSTRILKIDVPNHIYHEFVEQGHTVKWDRTHVGDDLSDWDAFFIGVGPMLSLNSAGGSLGALWALQCAVASGKPAVLFYDDWQIGAVVSHAKTMERHWSEYLHKQVESGGKEVPYYYAIGYRDVVEHYRDELLNALRIFNGSAPWPDNLFGGCPLYGWGDRSCLFDVLPFPEAALKEIDPSGVVPMPVGQLDTIDNKWSRWILSALNDHTEWVEELGLAWAVDYFGCLKRNDIRLRNEFEVVREYNERWGILSPPYPHAGSGWYRSRFQYAAFVQSIIYCAQNEREPIGLPPFSPIVMEKWGAGEKRKFAAKQASIINGQLGTPQKFAHQISNLFV